MIPLISRFSIDFESNYRHRCRQLITVKYIVILIKIMCIYCFFNGHEIDITVVKHNLYGDRIGTVIIKATERKTEKK